jgi:hypothetical protein
MPELSAVHNLAMKALERMSGGEIVIALGILVAGAVALAVMPSPIHDKIQRFFRRDNGGPPATPRRRRR